MLGGHRFFGHGIPYINQEELRGKLIVVEGPDCSGRSTQVLLLKQWVETNGLPVLTTGLRRSPLVRDAIQGAREGALPGRKTLSLLYATDFADSVESNIIPALQAGFVVLADRYVFTLMARDLVRGAPEDWLEKVLGFAVVPDRVFFLRATEEILLHRAFSKYGHLDYWESGMDMGLSRSMLESFLEYQQRIGHIFDHMAVKYSFHVIPANQKVTDIQRRLRESIAPLLGLEGAETIPIDLTELIAQQRQRGT